LEKASFDFSTEDFRELFFHSIFQYLNQNGINLSRIEDVFDRYEEEKIAHSINVGLSMVVERMVDRYLLNQGVLTEEQLGTELVSDFSIQVHPSTGTPSISASYKLFYKEKNLHFSIPFHLKFDEIQENEILDKMIGKIIEYVRQGISP
jgi:hypothetical protein